MCRYVFPWTIWRVPYLSSNQKLLQMQEYMLQVLNACPIETMTIVVLLLPLGQRLSTDKWPCHMEAPLVCTIHGANLIINIMPLAPFRPFAIPNENIRRCPRGQRTNPNDVAQAVNGNRNFVYAPGVFRIKQDNQKSKPRPRVTMMHHATKRGFKDCPGFLNSTGRLGPKRGRKCYVTPAFSGVPKRRRTKSEVKTYARGHHDAPRGP